jgi:cyclopropane fatty-acyl-phospholipid synthase-like methyltransferase
MNTGVAIEQMAMNTLYLFVRRINMNVILIKWRSKWEDYDELVGIAANEAVAHKHTKELATKYPDCYGDCYGTWYFEDFNLIEE